MKWNDSGMGKSLVVFGTLCFFKVIPVHGITL